MQVALISSLSHLNTICSQQRPVPAKAAAAETWAAQKVLNNTVHVDLDFKSPSTVLTGDLSDSSGLFATRPGRIRGRTYAILVANSINRVVTIMIV